MNGILKYSDSSYRITNEPELNRDYRVFLFNGIRLDMNGKKETVRMLFVRKPVKEDDLKKYGDFERIGKLSADFSDDKFHKKYHIDTSANNSFYLYATGQREPEIDTPVSSKRRKKLIIAAAAVVFLLMAAVIGAFAIGKLSKSAKDDPVSDAADKVLDDYALGDMNGDGSVNSIDASMILENYNKLSTGEKISKDEMRIGDVNRDGKSDASDASLILGYYSYLSSKEYISFDDYLNNYYNNY